MLISWKQAERIRERLDLEQATLAELAGCNRRYPCEFLNGKRIPQHTAERLVDVLLRLDAMDKLLGNVPIDWNRISKVRALLKSGQEAAAAAAAAAA